MLGRVKDNRRENLLGIVMGWRPALGKAEDGEPKCGGNRLAGFDTGYGQDVSLVRFFGWVR